MNDQSSIFVILTSVVMHLHGREIDTPKGKQEYELNSNLTIVYFHTRLHRFLEARTYTTENWAPSLRLHTGLYCVPGTGT